MRVVVSRSTSARLLAARQFVLAHTPDTEWWIVGATRHAADDFARALAHEQRATFGLHRFSLTQLAARLAAPLLAARHLSPTTALGIQAVAARALFDAVQAAGLDYFEVVAEAPGFPRALAQTLQELALAETSTSALGSSGMAGRDLVGLLTRFDEQLEHASAVDRARFFSVATEAIDASRTALPGGGLVLLDVPIPNRVEGAFVAALVRHAADALATTPDGDERTLHAYRDLGAVEHAPEDVRAGVGRLRQQLFAEAAPSPGPPLEEVELFSAPGEGREAVEIVRRILREARRGVAFDEIAVALRVPQQYAGFLEHALERAGIPTYFDRGTRRPHPAGRAFLALLACALDNLSARRFAEYLSLGQVPDRADNELAAYPVSDDEVFGSDRQRAISVAEDEEEATEGSAVRLGRPHARMPWRWERLLAESRVVSTAERWERRLEGLRHECDLQLMELVRTDPGSARIDHLTRKREDVGHLQAFALPIIRELGSWPVAALWSEWLERFERLAPRVLKRAERVLRVLADLRPMGAIGPIGLGEAVSVLTDRLSTIEADPPRRRYGRVLVTTPTELRGRSFRIVFVPALAERLFPQKPREDPLLLDEARSGLAGLARQADRAEFEKLQLRLAVGAAESRLYVSFPTLEVGDGRPRVPSLYALEVWRAMTGEVPSADQLQQVAAHASQATLAWPAPSDREEAIDALEHDLATLRNLINEPDTRARGRAQYMLQLNESLQRSVRERYMRTRAAWSRFDGIVRTTPRLQPILETFRLGARPYSLSALQRYSACPYQFFLGAIWRMRPADDLAPLERLDPLTRGSLFHAVQTDFYRRMKARTRPLTVATREEALAVLDEAIEAIAAREHELLAPAIERIWNDEISALRRDLRLWVDAVVLEATWRPKWFEWSFGLHDTGRDEASRPEAVMLDGRFLLHGSIDLVEERDDGVLRVTDHKTGKYRGKDHMVVDGGAALQPVLYSLALEAATGTSVAEGRLYYATIDGGYREVTIPITPDARRTGVEVLEIIDRALETGFLAPVPREKACTWCDFRPVCGPTAERRIARKAQDALADLLELRGKR